MASYYQLPSTFYWSDLEPVITEHLVPYAAVVLLAALVAVVGVAFYTRNISSVIQQRIVKDPLFIKYPPVPVNGEVQEVYFEDEYLLPPLRNDEGKVLSKPDSIAAHLLPAAAKQDYGVIYLNPPDYHYPLNMDEGEGEDESGDEDEAGEGDFEQQEGWNEEYGPPPPVYFDTETKSFKYYEDPDGRSAKQIAFDDVNFMFVDDEEGGYYYVDKNEIELDDIEIDEEPDDKRKDKEKIGSKKKKHK